MRPSNLNARFPSSASFSSELAASNKARLSISPNRPIFETTNTILPELRRSKHSAHASPQSHELTLAILKPSLCSYQPDVSAVLKELKFSSLNIVRTRRMLWTRAQAEDFYKEHHGRFYYDRLILGMTSGPSLSLALYGPGSIKAWRAMLGGTKACMTKWQDPNSLRGRYGLTDTRNGFHGSDSPESAKRELGLIFDGWDTEWWLAREAQISADQI